MLLDVQLPLEPFNSAVRDGTVGAKLAKILDALKPEAAYFTERNGHRGAILVVDLPNPSAVPALAEPWFLTFQAEVRFHVVMSPDDLKRAALEDLGKRWT
jgi:hypothetical protein